MQYLIYYFQIYDIASGFLWLLCCLKPKKHCIWPMFLKVLKCIFCPHNRFRKQNMGGHKKFVKLHNLLAWVYVQNRRIDELNNADAKTIISENLVIASLGNMPLLTTFRGISSIVVALGNPLRRLNIYIIISNLSNLARSKNSRGSKPERISGNYFDIINYVFHCTLWS